MDPALANTQKIAFKDAEISSFFDFCENVHELSNSKEPSCEIKMFVKSLGVYLRDETKTEVDRRDFPFLIVITLERFLNLCLI